MTWNIKNGGVGRLGAIASVIDREYPHILALQELRGFETHGCRRMAALADTVGMTPYLSRSAFGQPVGILVRPPLRMTGRAAVRWRLHHAATVALVPTGRGPVSVVSTHLNPFSPYRRMREARWLAARYGSGRRPVVLTGDLNSLEPGTDHADELAQLQPLYRSRHTHPGGAADTRAMAAFAAAGFIDLWPRVGTGDGRTAPTSQGGGAEFSGMRLDYVLATAPVAEHARAGHVARGGAAEHASDHYPVVVDFEI